MDVPDDKTKMCLCDLSVEIPHTVGYCEALRIATGNLKNCCQSCGDGA